MLTVINIFHPQGNPAQTTTERKHIMSFQINPYAFASFRTYGDAELFYNRTKPIRGQDKDLQGVPLRDDRQYWRHYSLKKRGDGSFAVRMYNTDIATFLPDGTTIINASYGSNSTNTLVERYTPRGRDYNAALYTRNGRPILAFNYQEFWADKPIHFKDGEIVNKPQLAVEKKILNRKRAAATRAKLQPFMDYIRTMRSLSADGMPSEALPAWEPQCSYDRDFDNPNNFPRLLHPYWQTAWIGGVALVVIRDGAEKEILLAAYARDEAYDWLPLEEGTTHKHMRYVVWNEPNL